MERFHQRMAKKIKRKGVASLDGFLGPVHPLVEVSQITIEAAHERRENSTKVSFVPDDEFAGSFFFPHPQISHIGPELPAERLAFSIGFQRIEQVPISRGNKICRV